MSMIKDEDDKNEIEQYFLERYKNASFRVVPGHWPDFKSKDDVDTWINLMEKMFDVYFE